MPHLYKYDLNRKPIHGISLINLYEYAIQNEARPHTHEFIEIGYVIGGRGLYFFNGNVKNISEGDIILTLPEEIHYEKQINENEIIEIIYIGINKATMLYSSQDFNVLNRSCIIHTKGATEFNQVFRNILMETIFQKPGYEMMVEHYLAALIILLSRTAESMETNPEFSGSLPELLDLRNDKIILELKQYLDNNITQNIDTINSLALRFYISRKQLMRIFKNTTGTTIKQYEIENKIKKAREMLLYSDLEIKDISESLNFSTIHYFYRQFKKATGKTPLQYRLEKRKTMGFR